MSRKTPAVRRPAARLTSRLMQRATWSRVSSSGGGAPTCPPACTAPFLGIRRGLRLVVVGDVVEHEAGVLPCCAGRLPRRHLPSGRECRDARRPDHAGRMELDEPMSISSAPGGTPERGRRRSLPAVARDLEGAPGAPGRQDDRPGGKDVEAPALAVVPRRRRATAVEEAVR